MQQHLCSQSKRHLSAGFLVLCSLALLFFPVKPLSAEGWVRSIIRQELIPYGCRVGPQRQDPNFVGPQPPCGIREMIITFINISRLLLGIIGSIALLVFTIGGLMLILSGGNQEKITRAKNILSAGIMGILIILTAWTIVNLAVVAISLGRGEGINTIGKIFQKPWTRFP